MAEPEEKPVFDFSRMSHKQARQLQRLFLEVQGANRKIAEGAIDDVDKNIAQLDSLLDQQDTYIASVLVDVPRQWLIADAPEKIKWNDPAALQWLRADKFKLLANAMQEAQRGN